MAARRPAGGEDAVRIAPPIRKIIVQPGGGGSGLDDDIVHPRLGGEGIASHRDADAVRESTLGNKGKSFPGVALPIAAMEEQQGRSAAVTGGEEVEPGARRGRIGHIARPGYSIAQDSATALPLRDDFGATGNSCPIVIGGV